MSDISSEVASEKESKRTRSSLEYFIEVMVLLKPYFWPDAGSDGATINRIRSSSTWLCVFLSKACSILSPLYIAKATDNLVSLEWVSCVHNVIVFSVLRFASSFFKELQGFVYLKVKQQAYIQLAVQIFEHLHSLSLSWHLSKKMGNVIRSMDRGTEGTGDLVSMLFLFLIPAFAECVAVCVVFFLHFKSMYLGFVVLIGVTVYTVITILITQWRKKFREASNKHDNEYHEQATDSMVNYETVKYFTAEQYEISRFRNSVSAYQSFTVSTRASMSLLNTAQAFVINLTCAFALVVAGKAVIDGEMDIGGFVAVNAYTLAIFAPLNFLGSVYAAIIQGFVDIQNLLELLEVSADVKDLPNAPEIPIFRQYYGPNKKPDNFKVDVAKIDSDIFGNIDGGDIELTENMSLLTQSRDFVDVEAATPISNRPGIAVDFKNIYFRYSDQPNHRGLKNITFHIPPGTTTAIVGHTGAGKTTISRLLFRFYDPLQGAVLFGGYDIRKYQQKSVRACVGIVPQDTVLFNDTILHNIWYGRLSATRKEIEEAAKAAQIYDFIESLPEKWNTVVGERGLKLSGGEKQRVSIARCLLKDPPIVLFDEATSALDTLTEQSIQTALQNLGSKRTVMVIAHRLSTIKHAEQIIVMHEGEIVEQGSHDALLSIPNGRYAAMWEMQVRNNTPLVSTMNLSSELNDGQVSPDVSISGSTVPVSGQTSQAVSPRSAYRNNPYDT